jgi:hypothetical protein
MIKNLWQQLQTRNRLNVNLRKSAKAAIASGLKSKPRLRATWLDIEPQQGSDSQESDRARRQLYRFLRDNVPVLNAVIWTWVRLCAADHDFEIVGSVSPAEEKAVQQALDNLDARIFQNGLMKRGGIRELLLQFFDSLFTDGAVCGELQLTPSRNRIERFQLADMLSISVEREGDGYRLYQLAGERKTLLNEETIFYYGLSGQPASVTGRSILQSIPFVARVEQTLISDMHRSMRSSGYHRIHVQLTPPERRADESEEDYFARTNSYFDDTAKMMRDFGPDKNPVTWNDVKIEYIGPSSKTSGSSAWYLNHKAMIEDICAGANLAPFMLGYAYGTTHNWAEFKYELVQRQVATVQHAAASLLDWLANVELALLGINVQVRTRFDNRIGIFLSDHAQAEKVLLDNIITKLDNKLITREEALRDLARL